MKKINKMIEKLMKKIFFKIKKTETMTEKEVLIK